ncbi:hypothetical protein ACFLY2_02460 [Patescibacteria group bacterium]
MKRRKFLMLLLSTAAAPYLFGNDSPAKISTNITVDKDKAGNSPTIIQIHLYGGPTELPGNLTNLDEITNKSFKDYPLNRFTKTSDEFWEEAGGDSIQEMVDNGDATIFRTCNPKVVPGRSHGQHVSANLRGTDRAGAPGIAANIAYLYGKNNVFSDSVILPFVTMEGESTFFSKGDLVVPSYLTEFPIGENLDNPYAMKKLSETTIEEYTALSVLGLQNSREGKIKENAKQAVVTSELVEEIKTKSENLPEGIVYPNTSFGRKIRTAMNLAIHNTDTKIISMGSNGLGGFDDHSNGVNAAIEKFSNLFESIKVAIDHAKALGRDNIIIQVFGDFGRNVNLNGSLGWDHGSNQVFYMFGGTKLLNHKGVVGTTKVDGDGAFNRMFLVPTDDSYQFDPLSIAATTYYLLGINDPLNELTAKQAPINPDGNFLKL